MDACLQVHRKQQERQQDAVNTVNTLRAQIAQFQSDNPTFAFADEQLESSGSEARDARQ